MINSMVRVSREDLLKEATSQFLAGKKSLLLHDFKNAVSCLEHATRIYDQVSVHFGPVINRS